MFLEGMAIRLKKKKENRPAGPWVEALVNPS
jgi:hypothetical protein